MSPRNRYCEALGIRIPRLETAKDRGWRSWLVDEQGYEIDSADVQLARLAGQEEEEA